MSEINLSNYNPNYKTFVCLPDIVEADEFILQLYKEPANVILIMRQSWITPILIEGAFALFTYDPSDDLLQTEKLILQKIKNLVSQVIPNRLQITSFVCFAEKNVEMMARIESNWFDNPSQIHQASAFRDKLVMRKLAEKFGVSQPEFARADDEVKINLMRNYQSGGKWNFIAKPRTHWGSQGVEFFETFEDFIKWKAKTSKPILELYLVETFIQGSLFHVDGIVNEGETCRHFCFRYGLPVGMIPTILGCSYFSDSSISPENPLFKRLVVEHDKIVTGFGLKVGMTHMEFFLEDRTNRIYFCEAAKRPPGYGVINIHNMLTGQSSMSTFAQLLVNDSKLLSYEQKGAVGVLSFIQPIGKIVSVSDILSWTDKEIIKKEVYDYQNKVINKIDYMNQIGRIYIRAKDEIQLEQFIKKFLDRFTIEMER